MTTAAAVKRLRRLSGRRSSRRSESRYLLDGPVVLSEALRDGVVVEEVFAEPGADPQLLEQAMVSGAALHQLPAGSLRKVLDVVTPRLVVAVTELRVGDAPELFDRGRQQGRPVLALVGIQDPGNAGTLIRVAEAVGCVGVVMTRDSVDPWNPKAVRASAGSIMRVPVAVDVEVEDLARLAQGAELELVATVADGGSAPETIVLSGGCVVLVGAEAHGLPVDLVGMADHRVTVPMQGAVESLNAAVSGSAVLLEAARQRRAVEPVGPTGGGVDQNATGGPRSPLERP